jgi:hypothetical protein
MSVRGHLEAAKAATKARLDVTAPEFKMPCGPSMDAAAPEFVPEDTAADVSDLRAEAVEFIPMAAAAAGWNAFEEAQRSQKRQMPYATDEEWVTRILKREKEVQTIKSLQSYRLYVEVFPRGERGEEDPKTPDAADRTVSKRMWKWNVEKWRLQLKSRCVYSRAVLLHCKEILSPCESIACTNRSGEPPLEADASTEWRFDRAQTSRHKKNAVGGSEHADASASAPSRSTIAVEDDGSTIEGVTLETEMPETGQLPLMVDLPSSMIPSGVLPSSSRKTALRVAPGL